MRYSIMNISVIETVLNLKFKSHRNLEIKKYVEDVFTYSISLRSMVMIISRQKRRLRSNFFEFDEKKLRKVSFDYKIIKKIFQIRPNYALNVHRTIKFVLARSGTLWYAKVRYGTLWYAEVR